MYAKQPEAQQLFSCLFAAVRPPDRMPLNVLHCRNIRRSNGVAEDDAASEQCPLLRHLCFASLGNIPSVSLAAAS